ncbi:zinc finger MYM-type protein 1-like [Capsicum annuum]|uniref:zinc finger MYM-type protein 1-like n=1 Tax=Capsicum annuum TaxID=4072 RepID=UPI001FB09409|nr:zinc finger MYM-type protein 1-like [Capsicum annuum]
MTSPDIQKDIVSSCAKEMVKAIIEDLNGDYFEILVMSLKIFLIRNKWHLFCDTSAKLLKEAIYYSLLDHSLSRSQIRGQGYDGASNMQGEINCLKTLILKDNSSAYCIHCFAHQLQLILVAFTKKHDDVNNFFDILANVLNIVGGSFKRKEMLPDDQAEKLKELLVLGEVHTGSGLNQELGLQRPGDTR